MGHLHSVVDGPWDKVMQRRHIHVLNLEAPGSWWGRLPSISLVSFNLLDVLRFWPLGLRPCLRHVAEQQHSIILFLPSLSSFSHTKTRDQAKQIISSWHPQQSNKSNYCSTANACSEDSVVCNGGTVKRSWNVLNIYDNLHFHLPPVSALKGCCSSPLYWPHRRRRDPVKCKWRDPVKCKSMCHSAESQHQDLEINHISFFLRQDISSGTMVTLSIFLVIALKLPFRPRSWKSHNICL